MSVARWPGRRGHPRGDRPTSLAPASRSICEIRFHSACTPLKNRSTDSSLSVFQSLLGHSSDSHSKRVHDRALWICTAGRRRSRSISSQGTWSKGERNDSEKTYRSRWHSSRLVHNFVNHVAKRALRSCFRMNSLSSFCTTAQTGNEWRHQFLNLRMIGEQIFVIACWYTSHDLWMHWLFLAHSLSHLWYAAHFGGKLASVLAWWWQTMRFEASWRRRTRMANRWPNRAQSSARLTAGTKVAPRLPYFSRLLTLSVSPACVPVRDRHCGRSVSLSYLGCIAYVVDWRTALIDCGHYFLSL